MVINNMLGNPNISFSNNYADYSNSDNKELG